MEGGPQEKGIMCIKLQRPEQAKNVERQEGDWSKYSPRSERGRSCISCVCQDSGDLENHGKFQFSIFFSPLGKFSYLSVKITGIQIQTI